MIDKVIDHLFVGTVEDAMNKEELDKNGIQMVVTTAMVEIEKERKIENIVYHFIRVEDCLEQDILSLFHPFLVIVEEAIKSSQNVLIHCEVGISRSAAFTMAYLMKRYQWTVDKALPFLKARRPTVCPNEGFIDQLCIFESIEWDLSRLNDSDSYRKWLVMSGNGPSTGTDERAAVFVKDLESTRQLNGSAKFRCIKCRNELFFTEHLQKHETRAEKPCPFRYLIDPLSWMKLEEYEGKINCPKCGEKLGNYCWGGRQCREEENGVRCGCQIQPWVHLTKDKIRHTTPIVTQYTAQIVEKKE